MSEEKVYVYTGTSVIAVTPLAAPTAKGAIKYLPEPGSTTALYVYPPKWSKDKADISKIIQANLSLVMDKVNKDRAEAIATAEKLIAELEALP